MGQLYSESCHKGVLRLLVLFMVQSYESAYGPVREITSMVHSNGSIVWFSHLFYIESIFNLCQCVVHMSQLHTSVLP